MTITGNRIQREKRGTGTEHRERREIQEIIIAGNTRYNKRTSRETGDGGREHCGKHETEKQDVARIVTHRNGH
jgi:hypothetical protein